jgi:TrmH family RNA methyltransferase
VRLFGLASDAFDNLSDARTPQPALAVLELPSLDVDSRFASPNGMYLLLVDVSDPGNVGTLIRTAEATGCAGVIVTPQTADVLSPKVVRASAGSVLRVPIAEVSIDDLEATLEHLDVQSVATAMDGEIYTSIDVDPSKPVALMLGSEAHGLDSAVSAIADHIVSIPMHGEVESLNVATAGAVLAFELASRRASTQ